MQTEIKVVLVCPLTLDNGAVLTEVFVPRPKNKHLKILEAAGFGGEDNKGLTKFSPMLANMLNLSDKEIDEVDIVDMVKLVEAVNSFLNSIPLTGGTL